MGVASGHQCCRKLFVCKTPEQLDETSWDSVFGGELQLVGSGSDVFLKVLGGNADIQVTEA